MSLSSIVVLLQLTLALLSIPGASSNPQTQVLAEEAIRVATSALAQPAVAGSASQHASSTSTQPIPVGPVTPAPTPFPSLTPSSVPSPTLPASTATPAPTPIPEPTPLPTPLTTPVQSVPFNSVTESPEVLVNTGPETASLNLFPNPSSTPMTVTFTILNASSAPTATECSSPQGSSCHTESTNTVTDPAYPDGLAANLIFNGLTPSTTYSYEVDLAGNGWKTSLMGQFETIGEGTWNAQGVNVH